MMYQLTAVVPIITGHVSCKPKRHAVEFKYETLILFVYACIEILFAIDCGVDSDINAW